MSTTRVRSDLTSKIALRYLFSKKSHNAVNVISIISICGVAIATMAIICVLSVFNGFYDVISGKLNQLSPDIRITASTGKTIANADSLISVLSSLSAADVVMPEIRENALATYDGRQMPVTLLGVNQEKFDSISAIQKLVKPDGVYVLSDNSVVDAPIEEDVALVDVEGVAAEEFDESALFADANQLYDDFGDVSNSPQCFAVISVGTAIKLSARPNSAVPLHIFTPRRLGAVNIGNPATSFITDSVCVAGVFQAEQIEYDSDLVIIDIDLARHLFQYSTEATAIDIKLHEGTDVSDFVNHLQSILGSGYEVKDRLQQQEVNYRMVSIEKWITFLLLTFILLIASFNILSTLSMLIIEKEESITTLHNMGASRSMISNIFRWETLYINIIGAIGGIVVGIGLCLLQQHFGLIKLNGDEQNLIISAYPVKVVFSDILIVLVPIIIIGLITSEIASRFAASRTSKFDD